MTPHDSKANRRTSSFRRLLTENFALKLISLLAALVLWLVVASRSR